MGPMSRLLVLVGLAAILASAPASADARPHFRVLVFSRTAGFHHDSIPVATAAIRELGARHRFTVHATDDPAVFSARGLRRYAAVVWLMTSGDVLDPVQERAFAGYVRRGGGYVGVHSASDTEYDWPFYGNLVGAYFKQHPNIQPATVDVAPAFASRAGLPRQWTRTDEWYDFRTNPRPRVHVLATLVESSYSGGTMGADHPIVWCHRSGRGRSWYTGMGHTAESWVEPAFRAHVLAGIRFAATGARAGCP
jgi:type 1 glutamine amidotransferase